MGFPFGRSRHRAELEDLRRQAAELRKDVERLDQEIGRSLLESESSTVSQFIQRLRTSMAQQELANKRTQLEALSSQVADLEVGIPKAPGGSAKEPAPAATDTAAPSRWLGLRPAPFIPLVDAFLRVLLWPFSRLPVWPGPSKGEKELVNQRTVFRTLAEAVEREARGREAAQREALLGKAAEAAELAAARADDALETLVLGGAPPLGQGLGWRRGAALPAPRRAGQRPVIPIFLIGTVGVFVVVLVGASIAGVLAPGPGMVPSPPATSASALITVELAPAISEPVGQPGEVFFTRDVPFPYRAGQVMLSGHPPPSSPFLVDDGMTMAVTRPDGTTSTWSHTFNLECEANTPLPARDVTEVFAMGLNRVSISLYDACGYRKGTSGLIVLSVREPAGGLGEADLK